MCCSKSFEDEVIKDSIAVRFDIDETKKQFVTQIKRQFTEDNKNNKVFNSEDVTP